MAKGKVKAKAKSEEDVFVSDMRRMKHFFRSLKMSDNRAEAMGELVDMIDKRIVSFYESKSKILVRSKTERFRK